MPYVKIGYEQMKEWTKEWMNAGLELSGRGVEPPVHVYRRLFLSENWL